MTATEELPYNELIDALARDWGIEASWDGLRRFWYIGWTDERVRELESVTIDQDWVRGVVERNSYATSCDDTGNGRWFYNDAYALMADEIFAAVTDRAATLGRGECGMVPSFTKPSTMNDCQEFCCSKCGEYMLLQQFGEIEDTPNYCPNCGRKVVDE